jgi:hypothetical protein
VICTSTSEGFKRPWKDAAREAMAWTVASVSGRNAVELVRPGECTSAPVESRMTEEERRGVLEVLVGDGGRTREDGPEFEEVGALGGGDKVGYMGDEGLE